MPEGDTGFVIETWTAVHWWLRLGNIGDLSNCCHGTGVLGVRQRPPSPLELSPLTMVEKLWSLHTEQSIPKHALVGCSPQWLWTEGVCLLKIQMLEP